VKKLLKIIDKVCIWGGMASGICILIITALIIIEIAIRAISGQSTFITEEYSAYLLVCFAFLGMAYTLKTDGHIRVSIFLSKVNPTKRQILEIFSGVVGLIVFAYLTVYMSILFFDSLTTGVRSMHVSNTPLFIPQLIPVIGCFFMVLQFISLLEKGLRTLIR
jgi:TRAP-type C4-dicarboxylate transport system permease small subunit